MTTTAATTQPSGLTYLLRRLGVIAALVAVMGLAVAAVTGRLDGTLGSLLDRGTTTELGSTGGPAEPDQTPFSVEATPSTRAERVAAARLDSDRSTVVRGDEAGLPAGAGAGAGAEVVAADQASDGAAGADPVRGARLVSQSPERVLDTRTGGSEPPPADTTISVAVPAGRTAAALSISLIGSERAGSVFVDGQAGSVEAISVGGSGATVTNLVFVPVVGDEVTVRSSAGGHLVVDIVGTFEPVAGQVAAGRFVPIDTARVTELETAVDGREATITFGETFGQDGASAVLAVITADVGDDGGVVRLGTDQDRLDQMLMWGPSAPDATASGKVRRGLVMLEPGDDDTAALTYDGGTALTVDVLGYFTDGSAPADAAGLYATAGPQPLFSGSLEANEPITVTGVEPGDGIGVATVAGRSAAGGRLWSVTTPVANGEVVVRSTVATEAEITLLGVFVT